MAFGGSGTNVNGSGSGTLSKNNNKSTRQVTVGEDGGNIVNINLTNGFDTMSDRDGGSQGGSKHSSPNRYGQQPKTYQSE